MNILPSDLGDPRVRALLEHHARTARAATAPGSAHALDPDAFKAPEITLWAAWDGDALLGVAALKRLADRHGEIKSMHTAAACRRRGVGSAMLRHIVDAARALRLTRLSLETGSWDYFVPARAFYESHGFVECAPFGDYVPDPNSVFMSRELRRSRSRPSSGAVKSRPMSRKRPETVDEYIARFTPKVQAVLRKIRRTVRRAAPKAHEVISYSMPALKQNGILVFFAAFKSHIGFYPPIKGNRALEKAAARYAGEKGNLRFPYAEPIPYALIAALTKLRAAQDAAKTLSRRARRSAKRPSRARR